MEQGDRRQHSSNWASSDPHQKAPLTTYRNRITTNSTAISASVSFDTLQSPSSSNVITSPPDNCKSIPLEEIDHTLPLYHQITASMQTQRSVDYHDCAKTTRCNSSQESKPLNMAKKPQPKKRGRPRKDNNNVAEISAEERRRKQIRLAQRAFREREKTALSQSDVRISRLETSLMTMHSMVTSFGHDLIDSGALARHSDLHLKLSSLLTTCDTLIEGDEKFSNKNAISPPLHDEGSSPWTKRGPHAPRAQSIRTLHEHSSASALAVLASLPELSLPAHIFSPLTSVSQIHLSKFVHQVRLGCAHYALSCLRNPANTVEQLRNKFRFLLSLMSREDLTSYFEASVQSHERPERMLRFKQLPFFRLGGAGTHFLAAPIKENHCAPVQDDPLQGYLPDIHEHLRGKWFDSNDLEGFLREQQIYLSSYPPPKIAQIPSNVNLVNASALIKCLVRSSICLGRSPGWRPSDVEMALQMSSWKQAL